MLMSGMYDNICSSNLLLGRGWGLLFVVSRTEELALVQSLVVLVKDEFVVVAECNELVDGVHHIIRKGTHVDKDAILVARVLNVALADDPVDLLVLCGAELANALRQDLTVPCRVGRNRCLCI